MELRRGSMGKQVLIFFFWLVFLSQVSAGTSEDQAVRIRLSKVVLRSDIPVDEDEIFYLMGFGRRATITQQDLEKAREALKKKKRFGSISFSIATRKNKKVLFVDLKAHWLLKKIVIKGIAWDKQRYKSLYNQRAGDEFDVSSHEESIKAIELLLKQQGYLYACVTPYLAYEQETKSITVQIRIAKGARILVDHVEFVVPSKIISGETLHEKIGLIPRRQACTREFIEKLREKIKKHVRKLGIVSYALKVDTRFINKKRVVLIVTIAISKKLICTFSGNTFFSDKELIDTCIGQRPSWLLSPDLIAEHIRHAYKARGFAHVVVSIKRKSRFVYHFSITEHEPIQVRDIRIQMDGRDAVGLTRFFDGQKLAVSLDDDLLQLGMHKLRSHLVEQGYWDCKLNSQREVTHEGTYDVVITAIRGVRRTIRSVTTRGAQGIIAELPTPAHLEALLEQRKKILSMLHERGYWYADVQPEITSHTLDATSCYVDVVWAITPGEQVTFGKVLVTGTTRLPFRKIIGQLPFKSGDIWDRKKIELARSRLKHLNIFRHIQLQPSDFAQTEKEKNIVLTLYDDNPFELRLRAGYYLTSKNFLFKRASTYKAGGSFLIKNPSNAADMLVLNADYTRFERNAHLDYQRPYLFGTSLLSKLHLYTNKYIHPVQIGKSESAYEALQHGILASVSNEYRKNYYWGLTIGNEWMETSRVRGDIKLDPSLINRVTPYFVIEPNLVIDALDDKIEPRFGGETILSAKLMVPQGRGTFTARVSAEQSLFVSLSSILTFAIRVRLGHIFRRAFEQIMPIERFYLGGAHSIRGYEKDAAPPFGICTRDDGSNEITIQGGSSMFNLNLEMRFALYGALRGVVFHDIGVLSQIGFAPYQGEVSAASGFGLRYATPIGPIRFDIGRKWEKLVPEQNRYVWYLTIGHAF